MLLGHAASLLATIACVLLSPGDCAVAGDGADQSSSTGGSQLRGSAGAASDHAPISTGVVGLRSTAAVGLGSHAAAATGGSMSGGSAATRSAALGEGAASLGAFVEGQVDRALQSAGSYSASGDILEALAAFKDHAKALQDQVLELHTLDQESVDEALDMIKDCEDKELLQASHSAVDSHRREHEACRVLQAAMVDTTNTTCQEYTRAWQNAANPPACSLSDAVSELPNTLEVFGECLDTTYKWTANLWTPFEACRTSRLKLDNQTQQCDASQEQFESSACLLTAKQAVACSCISRAAGQYEAHLANVSAAAAIRQHIYTSATRMGCYIDALVSNNTNKTAALHSCKQMVVNVSHLAITYGSVDAPGYCPVSPPCSESWLSEEYEAKRWHGKAPAAACSQCESAGASTLAPAPAPTSAPAVGVGVYGNGAAFMVLNKNTGQAQCWGRSDYGGDCSGVDFAGVTDVYSTGIAFMALNKNTGQAQCWGYSDYGGDCSSLDFAGFTDVYSNYGAFIALNKNTGQAQCWGRSSYGSDCSGVDFAGVTDVYGTKQTSMWVNSGAFMALNKNTGHAQCWGHSSFGGDCSGVDFAGVTDVYSTEMAFMALNKNTGQAQCWGGSSSGGDCSGLDFAGFTDVYSTYSAFMALNKNTGQAQCWGSSSSGGDCSSLDVAGVTDVYRTAFAFMVLNKNTGQAQCWGRSDYGGDCSGVDFAGVADVYSNYGAFMALNKNTGQAHCWGHSNFGGDCSGVDFAGVTDAYSNHGAFMALNKNTGQAQCWGRSESGGDCSGVDFEAVFASG